MKKVAIIMGSDSDLPVAEKAAQTLEQFGVPFQVHIFSAHRTPDAARDFARGARAGGFGAIIAAAGMAAHLAGAIAANTTLPVVGIPLRAKVLGGVDALLATVQMLSDEGLAEKLEQYRRDATEKVLAKNAAVEARFDHS